VWDCQLAEHIYTGQKAQFISLNECLIKYGLETKIDLVKELWEAGTQTDDIPIPILQEYNEWDVIQTEKLFLVQQELLSDEQKRLVYLLGEDLKVLANIEHNGLLFDSDKAGKYLTASKEQVGLLELQLASLLPTISHGTFNWDSGDHLSCFLYGGTIEFDYAIPAQAVYKSGPKRGEQYTKNSWHIEKIVFPTLFSPIDGTETKKTKDKTVPTRIYQTDAPTLASLKGNKTAKNVLTTLQKRSETQKVCEMLESLFKQFNDKQWTDNLIHGQFNQNVAVTGRLSSSAPNMQNQPPEVEQFFISRYAN
jgi:DNA polymerase I-like protein with 3'-5' exonuclease and polymerase domains